MIGSTQPTISRQEIIEQVSEADILGYYLGITNIPTVINSPLRQDNNPSFALYSPNGREVNYVDFSTNDKGGCMALLMKLFNIDRPTLYKKIQSDLLKFNKVVCQKSLYNKRVSVNNSKAELQCKIRNWRKYDIEYWKSYGIDIEWLKYAEVYPISHKIIIRDGKKSVFGADKYAYTFVERKEGKITHKFYQPFNKVGFKWQNDHDKSVLGLWSKLPDKGDKICICSSVKDALCLMCNLHIPCICIQGEKYPISNTAMKELKRRFTRVYVCLDNDEAGKSGAESLSRRHNIINVVIPQFHDIGKDISDYYYYMGKEKFIETFSKLFKDSFYEGNDELPF